MAENQNLTAEMCPRFRDENRAMHLRKKRPCDNPAAQKERNEMRKRSESTKQSGRLEYYYVSKEEKMDTIKITLDRVNISIKYINIQYIAVGV